jgi:hypothetical protein
MADIISHFPPPVNHKKEEKPEKDDGRTFRREGIRNFFEV